MTTLAITFTLSGQVTVFQDVEDGEDVSIEDLRAEARAMIRDGEATVVLAHDVAPEIRDVG